MKGRWVWLDKLWRDVKLWVAWIAAESGVRDYRDSDAGAGGGREYGGVQRDECGAAAVAAGERSAERGVREDHGCTAARSNQTGDWETSFSYPVYDALRQQKSVLSEVMVYVPLSIDKVGVRIGAQPEEAEADMVSGNFFSRAGSEAGAGARIYCAGRDWTMRRLRDQLQLLDARGFRAIRMCWGRRCM